MSYFLGLGTSPISSLKACALTIPIAGAGNDDDDMSEVSDDEEDDEEDAAEIDLEQEEVKRPTKKAKRS